MNYQQAWTFLDNLQFFKIKLGLDAMTTFLGRVGNPHRRLSCVHIGGTNGKGSVASTLLSILTAAGYKIGLYTSPHLSDVRERFRIGDDFISRDDFARLTTRIQEILAGEQITYFEFTTTLAMLWFAEQGVDLALMEVGMGGRLDATNVITPLVSVITNVSMDHEQYLGTTLAEVAGEKAGIIKPGIPVVTSVDDEAATAVMEEKCRQTGSPLYLLGRDFSGSRSQDGQQKWDYNGIKKSYTALPLAMKGGYQHDNGAMALAALELLHPTLPTKKQDLEKGLAGVHWPGRLEELHVAVAADRPNDKHHVLLDGAHNPAGVEALRRALEDEFDYRELILIWGAMADKDIAATLETIGPLADHIIFTRPESERSARPDDLRTCLSKQNGKHKHVMTMETVNEALDTAATLATGDDLICIAGSLYLVGRARQILLGELVP